MMNKNNISLTEVQKASDISGVKDVFEFFVGYELKNERRGMVITAQSASKAVKRLTDLIGDDIKLTEIYKI